MSYSDFQCPYCDADIEICHDDGHGYDEDINHEEWCSSCRKTFTFTTSIIYHYEPSKADCLNEGGEHQLKLTTHYPECFRKMRCETCDYERALTDNEHKEYGVQTYAEYEVSVSKDA